jgi:hypothetical protein
MTPDEIRAQMETLWAEGNRAADELKDPFIAMERVTTLYVALDADERATADQVLADWALSPNEAKRFDAIALVRELVVQTAVPALRRLTMRLASSDDPGAPFEREKVQDVLVELGVDGSASV